MERIRVAGILQIQDGIALMHRKNVVKNKDFQEYYTFPGGRIRKGRVIRRRSNKGN